MALGIIIGVADAVGLIAVGFGDGAIRIIGRCGVAMRPRASKVWSSPLGQILDEFTDETHIDTRFTDSKICQAVYFDFIH